MKIKALFWVVLFLTAAAISAFADAGRSMAIADYTMELQFGKEVELDQPETQMLCSTALEVLETANFNSSDSQTQAWPEYQVLGVQKDYRWTVSKKYLVVSFKEARKIETLDGVVNVREIVIGLNLNDNGRNQLFTIDDNGRVISHAKYGGTTWINLLKAAKKVAGDS